MWRECPGEHAAHEYEFLILVWPAHSVVAGRPLDHQNPPAALIGADKIPALLPQKFVFRPFRRARQVPTARIDGSSNTRCGWNGLARLVPGNRLRVIEPRSEFNLSVGYLGEPDEYRDGEECNSNKRRCNWDLLSDDKFAPELAACRHFD